MRKLSVALMLTLFVAHLQAKDAVFDVEAKIKSQYLYQITIHIKREGQYLKGGNLCVFDNAALYSWMIKVAKNAAVLSKPFYLTPVMGDGSANTNPCLISYYEGPKAYFSQERDRAPGLTVVASEGGEDWADIQLVRRGNTIRLILNNDRLRQGRYAVHANLLKLAK